MSSDIGSIVTLICFFVFLLSGIPIALALAGAGAITILLILGTPGFAMIAISAYQMLDHFVLITIPLFILMGNILIYSGLASELMELFSSWFSKVPNGLGVSAIASSAVFAAMCGSSSAATATIGEIAVPEMLKRGYSKRLSCGTIAAAGGLAILIPPSNEMIQYCIVSELSVGHLFMAGVLPGILLSFLMGIYVMLVKKSAPITQDISWKSRLVSLNKVWPAALLILVVLGGIYFGITTPTEAAASGAFAALLLVSFYYRTFNCRKMREALLRTIKVSVMIFMVIAGAGVFSQSLILTNVPQTFTAAILGISTSKWIILVVIVCIFILAGMILTVTAMTFVIVPLVLPVIAAVKLDPTVFAITYTILAETALITPPVGMNLYIINAIVKESRFLEDISYGAVPYVFIFIITIVLLWIFPDIVLWLPSTMK